MSKFARWVILLILPLSQVALAEPDPFGTPISEAVIVFFPDSSAQFKPSADQATTLIEAKAAALVTIRGRTSTDKPSAKDELLALSRALSARSYLIARGVSPLKITINFASAADFIADNSTQEGRWANQRVEVELIYVMPRPN